MSDDEDEGETPTGGPQRIDRWLWFTRVVKSRTLAAGLVTGGKVRLNRTRIDKASQTVKCGDVITVSIGGRVRVLKVLAPGVRRGPAQEAQTLYDDMTPPPSPESLSERTAPPAGPRPSKKGRRQIIRFKQAD